MQEKCTHTETRLQLRRHDYKHTQLSVVGCCIVDCSGPLISSGLLGGDGAWLPVFLSSSTFRG